MQIIIKQLQIEEAIRDHILNLVNTEDGMNINIDLKATRGSDGYQAIIDITYPSEAANNDTTLESGEKVTVTSKDSSAVATAKPRRKRRTKAEMEEARRLEAAGGQPAAPVAETPIEETPVEAVSETAQDDDSTDQADAQPETAEASEESSETEENDVDMEAADMSQASVDETPVPAPRPSIFGGLNKPINA